MTNFRYKAMNRNQCEVSGYIEANSPRGAEKKLRALGLLPVSVDKVQKEKAIGLSMEEKIHFVNELQTMIASGISVLEALNVIFEHTKKRSIKYITRDLTEKIKDGKTFSEALTPYENTFGGVVIGLCKAGEYSGKLGETLKRAIYILKKEDKNCIRIKKLSIYPTIVTLITIGFTLYFGFAGFPTIIETASLEEKDIPFLVNALVKSCEAIKNHWFISSVTAIASSIFLFKFIQKNTLGLIFNKFLLMFRQVKNAYLYLNLSSFFAILSSSYEAGITIPQGINLASSSIMDENIRKTASEVEHMVSKGRPLSEAFMVTELIPESWNAIIAAGEKSGEMGKMFNDIAVEIDKTVDDAIEVLMQFFQPLLMLFVGIIMGIFAVMIIQMSTATLFNMF